MNAETKKTETISLNLFVVKIINKRKNAGPKDPLEFIDQQMPRVAHLREYLGDGLAYTTFVETKLKNHDYIGVLRCIWSESDLNRRKNWLEAKAHQGHPLLMIEYGKIIAYQTSIEEGLKWFYLGLFRAQQDAACCDCALFNIVNQLIEREIPITEHEIPKQWLEIPIDQWLQRARNYHKKRQTIAQFAEKAKQQALIELKNWKQFPSPQWITYSAPQVEPGKAVRLKPETEWQKIRDQVIQENLKPVNKEKRNLMSKQGYFRPLIVAVGVGLSLAGFGLSLYFFRRYFANPPTMTPAEQEQLRQWIKSQINELQARIGTTHGRSTR